MSDLEERGLLSQPHASAGRVPTDLAYRLYVDRLMARPPIDVSAAQAIDEALQHRRGEIPSSWARPRASSPGLAARRRRARPRHAADRRRAPRIRPAGRLIAWSRSWSIAPASSTTGSSRVQDAFEQSDLDRVGRELSQRFSGQTLPTIREAIARELTRRAVRVRPPPRPAARARAATPWRSTRETSDVLVEGASNLVGALEFNDLERTKELLRTLEQKGRLVDLLESVLTGRRRSGGHRPREPVSEPLRSLGRGDDVPRGRARAGHRRRRRPDAHGIRAGDRARRPPGARSDALPHERRALEGNRMSHDNAGRVVAGLRSALGGRRDPGSRRRRRGRGADRHGEDPDDVEVVFEESGSAEESAATSAKSAGRRGHGAARAADPASGRFRELQEAHRARAVRSFPLRDASASSAASSRCSTTSSGRWRAVRAGRERATLDRGRRAHSPTARHRARGRGPPRRWRAWARSFDPERHEAVATDPDSPLPAAHRDPSVPARLFPARPRSAAGDGPRSRRRFRRRRLSPTTGRSS